jgi:general secretion pathway protein L
MSGILSGITETTARGLRWWAGELRSFAPGHRSQGVSRESFDVIVSADAQGNCISLQRVSSARSSGGQFRSQSVIDVSEALTQIARAHPKTKVGIMLPFAACFERRIEIPATARGQAEAILTLDFERSTPFKLSEVYAAHALAPARTKKGWLTASQFIVKRKIADNAIATVETHGLKVACLDLWPVAGTTPIGVNLLAVSRGTSMPVRSRRPLALVAAAIVGLTISAVWTGFSRWEAALASLESEVSVARKSAEALRGERAVTERARQMIEAVHAYKQAQPSTVEIINEITHLLPDDVVLNDLKVDRDTVELSGVTASSAAVVPILERSTAFRDVVFSAPVTFDGAAGKERFSLRLQLRRPLRTLAEVASPGAVQ